MKIDLKTLLLLGVIALLCFFLFDTCKDKKATEDEASAYANYKDTAMTYRSKSGDLVSYNRALEMDKNLLLMLNDSLKDALKDIGIKDPVSYTKIVTVTQIDTVRVTFTEKLPCDPFSKPFFIDSTHYQIGGLLTESDLTFNSITIPNRQDIVVGTKKNGFLKKNEYVVTVQNTNPYMDVIGIQNYTLKPKKKLWEKGWFNLSVGFVGGFLTSRRLSTP